MDLLNKNRTHYDDFKTTYIIYELFQQELRT